MKIEQLARSLNKQGIFYRNPRHLDLADRAFTQSDIVNAIAENRREKKHEIFKYEEEDSSIYMPGTVKLRQMSRDEVFGYFTSLLKIRPRIFMIRVSLGEYPDMQEIKNDSVNRIGSRTARKYEDIAGDIADLFERYRIVDFVYMVQNAESGKFMSRAFAFEAPENDYSNDSLFNPTVEIEYIGE